jgi:hypothetical protein
VRWRAAHRGLAGEAAFGHRVAVLLSACVRLVALRFGDRFWGWCHWWL